MTSSDQDKPIRMAKRREDQYISLPLLEIPAAMARANGFILTAIPTKVYWYQVEVPGMDNYQFLGQYGNKIYILCSNQYQELVLVLESYKGDMGRNQVYVWQGDVEDGKVWPPQDEDNFDLARTLGLGPHAYPQLVSNFLNPKKQILMEIK